MAKCCIALSRALLDDNGSLNSTLKMWFKARFAKRAYLLCAPAFTKTAGCWTISEEATSCQEHATYVHIRLPLCIYVRSLVSFNWWTLKWWNQTLERIWHIKVNWLVYLYKSTGSYWLVTTMHLPAVTSGQVCSLSQKGVSHGSALVVLTARNGYTNMNEK